MNDDRYSPGAFNITGEAQSLRRMQLRRHAEGDMSAPPPARPVAMTFNNFAHHRWSDSHMNLTRTLADVDKERR